MNPGVLPLALVMTVLSSSVCLQVLHNSCGSSQPMPLYAVNAGRHAERDRNDVSGNSTAPRAAVEHLETAPTRVENDK